MTKSSQAPRKSSQEKAAGLPPAGQSVPLAPLPRLAETDRSIHLYLFLYAETFTSPTGRAWVHSPQGQLAGEDALLQALPPPGDSRGGRQEPRQPGDQKDATRPASPQPRRSAGARLPHGSLRARPAPPPWQRSAHLDPCLNPLELPLFSSHRRLPQWKLAPPRLPRPLRPISRALPEALWPIRAGSVSPPLVPSPSRSSDRRTERLANEKADLAPAHPIEAGAKVAAGQ